MATIDWYFDFISPFAYIQSEMLGQLGSKTRIRYRPVLFAGLLAAHGQQGPGRDSRQARIHLSLRLLAGGQARHPLEDAARASLQSAAAVAPGHRLRLRARGDPSHLPLRVARRPPARPAHRMGRARARPAHSRCRAPDRRARGQGGAPAQYRRGHRARRVRRARRSPSATSSSGARTPRRWRPNTSRRDSRYADPEYARLATLPVGVTRTPPPAAKRTSKGGR